MESASVWPTSAKPRDSRCAGAIDVEAGAPGATLQQDRLESVDPILDWVLLFSIAAIIGHPGSQCMADCVAPWHEIAASKGTAPRTMRSRAITTLEKNFIPV